MDHIELLKRKRRGLANVLSSLDALDKNGDMRERYGETLTDMRDALRRLDGEIDKLVRDPAHVDMPAFVQAYVDLKVLVSEIDANLPAPGARQTAIQKTVRRYNNELNAAFTDLRETCGDEIVRSFSAVDMQRKLYGDADTFMADVAKQKDILGLHGIKPTMAECTYMTLSNVEPMRFFNALIWLSRNEAALEETVTGENRAAVENHPFHKALARMKASVAAAPLDKQAKLAQLMVRQEVVTGDEAQAQYDLFLGLSRARTAEDKKAEACANLSGSEAYRSFESLRSLRASFDGTLLAAMMDRCSLGETREKPGIGQRNREIRALAAGGMKAGLSEVIAREAAEFRKNTDRGVVLRNGSVPGSRAWDNYDLYNRMRAGHTADASGTYRALELTMGRLADEDPEAEDKTAYLRRLREAEKVSRAYLNTHRKNPWTDLGKERVALARELHTYAQSAIDAIEAQRIAQNEAAVKALKGEEHTHEIGERINKLQRVIGTTHINPPQPKMDDGIMEIKKSGVGHVLYGATHWLINNTVGRLWEAVTLPWSHYDDKKVTTTLNTDRIPGQGDREFEKLEPEKLPDDQPMITDVRRIPLVWEQPIPEDPNQPPTVTLEIEQAREGDAIGNAAVEGDRFAGEMGHAFIRLNYTKTDPVTGLPQRYRTSFGFYPKGGFLSPAITTAMYSEGLMIPGQLKEDIGHIATVGKTYTVTNKQFNRLVLAAQAYEKDGYNYFTRNCTTFVRDMAEKAGLDTGDLFKEVDLTSDTIGTNLGAVGLTVLGLSAPVGHFARRDVLAKAGRDDLSYQRFGQKMVNVEDVERFSKWSHHLTGFYSRAKGYAPGHAGESLRHDRGFRLHSMDYEGSEKNKQIVMREFGGYESYEDYEKNLDAAVHYPAMIALEFEDLISTIRALKGYDEAADGPMLDRFRKFHRECWDPIKSGMNLVIDRFSSDVVDVDQYCKDTTAAINRYIEGLDEIYRDSFKSDPRLNVPFQHLVSVLEHTREKVYDEYQNLYVVNDTEVSLDQLKIDGTQRDMGRAAMRIVNKEFEYKTPFGTTAVMTPAGLVAAIRVFGSADEYVKFIFDYQTLESKEKNDTITSAETGRLTKSKLKIDLISDFTKAEKQNLLPHMPTAEEIEFAFRTLPQQEMAISPTNSTDAADCYQSLILDNLFHGLLPKLRRLAEETRPTLDELPVTPKKSDFKAEAFNKKSEEEKAALERAEARFREKKQAFEQSAAALINQHITEKLGDPEVASRFDMIMRHSAVHYAAKKLRTAESHLTYDMIKDDIINGAKTGVYDTLIDRFVNKVCDELSFDTKPTSLKKAEIAVEQRVNDFFTCKFDKNIFPAARELQDRQNARDEEVRAAMLAEHLRIRERIRLSKEQKRKEALARKREADPDLGRKSVRQPAGKTEKQDRPASRRNSVGAPSAKPALDKKSGSDPKKGN